MRVDGRDIGVRFDDERVLYALRDALHDRLGDVAAPVRYSIRTRRERTSGSRALAVVYRDTEVVLRSRSRARALIALGEHLACHAVTPSGLLRIDALGAVGDNGLAVVVPRPADACTFDRHLAANGMHVIDAPALLVDALDMTVVVPDPFFGSAVRSITGVAPGLAEEAEEFDDAPARPGRYPIVAWALPSSRSRGARVAQLASLTQLPPEQRSLPALTSLAEQVHFVDERVSRAPDRARWMAGLAAANPY
ncbi:MAG: hypothetical protein QOI55_490 [Actinomycetota bacterium]|nr:hypothetical protein [Actinomycetota bacterium]